MYSLYIFVVFSALCYEVTSVKLTIEQGTLHGEKLKLVTGNGEYYSFKSIPYAAPPVGPLRFKAPQPASPWSGVRNATIFGSECPQKGIFPNKITGNEDCLFLNVFSPNLKPNTLAPVYVVIEGEGFESRFESNEFYGPDFLVEQGLILVTLNYRLGALGFLSLDTRAVPGNAGLKDQVAALRWIQNNIRHFGGDPKSVTLFGMGSGAVSISLHMLSPMSKGLFKGVVLISGVWQNMRSFEARRRALRLGSELGCYTKDPQKLLEYLQNQPVAKIVLTNPSIMMSDVPSYDLKNMYYYAPVVEKVQCTENFLNEEPENLMARGLVSDVNMIIGYTDRECLSRAYLLEKEILKYYTLYLDPLVPWNLFNQITPKHAFDITEKILNRYFPNHTVSEQTLIGEYIPFCSEAHVINDVYRYIKKLPKFGNSKIYLYEISSLSERNIYSHRARRFGLIGTTYGDGLPYMFNVKGLKFYRENTRSYRMIRTLCTLALNFAKYGNPTPNDSLGAIWPEYYLGGYKLEINNTLTARRTHSYEAIQFWDDIYDSVNAHKYC